MINKILLLLLLNTIIYGLINANERAIAIDAKVDYLISPGIYTVNGLRGYAEIKKFKVKVNDYYVMVELGDGKLHATSFEANCFVMGSNLMCPLNDYSDLGLNLNEDYVELIPLSKSRFEFKCSEKLVCIYVESLCVLVKD